jgi:hypothetical protein
MSNVNRAGAPANADAVSRVDSPDDAPPAGGAQAAGADPAVAAALARRARSTNFDPRLLDMQSAAAGQAPVAAFAGGAAPTAQEKKLINDLAKLAPDALRAKLAAAPLAEIVKDEGLAGQVLGTDHPLTRQLMAIADSIQGPVSKSFHAFPTNDQPSSRDVPFYQMPAGGNSVDHTITTWGQELGVLPTAKGDDVIKKYNAQIAQTTRTYVQAKKDYNETVDKGGAEVEDAMRRDAQSGALGKLNAATDGKVFDRMKSYQQHKADAASISQELHNEASLDVEAAGSRVESATAKLEKTQSQKLKGIEEKKKAELEERIKSRRELAGDIVKFGKGVLKAAEGDPGDLVELLGEKSIGFMLTADDEQELVSVKAKIDALDEAIQDSSFSAAKADLVAAKKELQAKLAKLTTLAGKYAAAQKAAWDDLDSLANMEKVAA